jgi:hypothetical protein
MASSIYYEIQAFSGPLPNGMVSPGSGRRPFSMKQLVWAAATIGGNPFGPRLGRRERALEMQWREAMIRASVPADSKHFYKSRSYRRGLTPTEKGAVSFFLGEAQAKLFACDFFHVSKLVAYDHYLEYHNIHRSGTRPDFLGYQGKRITIVLEAKGRSGYYSAAVVNAAKQQALSIPPIAGHPQPIAYVHLAYFWDDEWCAYLEDPPRHQDASGPAVDPEILTLAYYHPIVAATRARRSEQVQIDGVRYLRTSFEDVDTHLLVRADIADLVPPDEEITAADPDRLRSVSAPLYELALVLDGETMARKTVASEDDDDDDPRFIGDDGVGVELGPSWLEQRSEDDE